MGCILVAVSTDSAQLFFSLLTFVAAAGSLVASRAAARRSGSGATAARRARSRRSADASTWLAFLVAATATLGSLYFSEVAHFVPCRLCWFQRIAMYPAVGDPARRRDPARPGGAVVRRPARGDRRGDRRLSHAHRVAARTRHRRVRAVRAVVHRRLVPRSSGSSRLRTMALVGFLTDPLTHVRPLPGHTRRRTVTSMHRRTRRPVARSTLESHLVNPRNRTFLIVGAVIVLILLPPAPSPCSRTGGSDDSATVPPATSRRRDRADPPGRDGRRSSARVRRIRPPIRRVGLASPVVTGEEFDGAADHDRRPGRRADVAGLPRPLVPALQRRDARADRAGGRRRASRPNSDVIGISTGGGIRPARTIRRRNGSSTRAGRGRRWPTTSSRVHSLDFGGTGFPFLVIARRRRHGARPPERREHRPTRSRRGSTPPSPLARLTPVELRVQAGSGESSPWPEPVHRRAIGRRPRLGEDLGTGRPSAVGRRAASSNSTLTRWPAILTPIV